MVYYKLIDSKSVNVRDMLKYVGALGKDLLSKNKIESGNLLLYISLHNCQNNTWSGLSVFNCIILQ
jgi:hypothetical protein